MRFSHRLLVLQIGFALIVVLLFWLFTIQFHARIGEGINRKARENEKAISQFLDAGRDEDLKAAVWTATWDELVRFVGSGDRAWAGDNLDTLVRQFELDHLYVLGLDGRIVYRFVRNADLEKSLDFFRDPEFLQTFLSRRSMYFYLRGKNRVYCFTGSTIQPSSDFAAKSSPRGFLIQVKALGEEVPLTLSGLTGTEVRWVSQTNGGEKESRFTTRIRKALKDWKGREISTLEFVFRHGIYESLYRSLLTLLWIAGGVLLAGIGLMTHYLTFRLRKPLQAMEHILQDKAIDPAYLERMRGSQDDLGSIVNLVVENRRKEKALKESEARWQFALEGTHQGVWDWNIPEGRVYYSRGWESMVGSPPGRLGNTPDEWLGRIHPDDKKRTVRTLENFLMGVSSEYQCEYRMMLGGPVFIWVQDRGMIAEWNAEWRPVRAVGVIHEITRRKEAEYRIRKDAQDKMLDNIELSSRKSELEAVVKSKIEEIRAKDRMMVLQSRQAAMGEMISAIAHQWKQPLSLLGMIVQNMAIASEKGGLDDVAIQKIQKKIERQITHMSRTVDDFRNFFKPSEGNTPFSVGRETQNTFRLIEYDFRQKAITVDFDIREDCEILGRPNEFGQAVMNFLTNSKAILLERKVNNPRLVIRIYRSNGKAVLEVEDNGGGIPEEILDRVGEAYFTTRKEGTGIGLYMSRMIIETHLKGSLEIMNSNDGALFRVRIPAIESPEHST